MSTRRGSTKKRPQKRAPGAVVLPSLAKAEAPAGEADPGRPYVEGDPTAIVLGTQRLDAYLRETPLRWVLDLDKQLRDLDWALFDTGVRTGRRPLHPRILVGLITYGLLRQQSSLRALEALAATDLGAWWLCGGMRPDHSTLGKFIETHAVLLSEAFFHTVTRGLARNLGVTPEVVALDGTIVESAGSRFRVLRAEAAKAARDAAAQTAATTALEASAALASSPPETTEAALAPSVASAVRTAVDAQRKLEAAQEVVTALEERTKARAAVGHDTTTVCVCATDPAAVVQPRKDHVMRPAWCPVALAHANGLVLGQLVSAVGETAAVLPLLVQHDTLLGVLPTTTLLDGLYFTHEVLQTFVDLECDVLCTVPSTPAQKSSAPGKLPKHLFVYQPESDTYRCPAGRLLVPGNRGAERDGRAYRRYVGTECEACPRRAECTTSKAGRLLKRYEGDELKEALATTMRHPQARACHRRRMVMIEPIFAALRERQGLTRFRRRGRRLVAAEFALHCVAYNLRKAQRLTERREAERRAPCRGRPGTRSGRRLAGRATGTLLTTRASTTRLLSWASGAPRRG